MFGRFLSGSTCHSIRPGLSNTTAKDRLRFIRQTLTCAKSKAYITNTLYKLVLTQSSTRFLFLSCVNNLFWSFGAKGQEDREDLCSSWLENTKMIHKCINHFCRRSSIFENKCSRLESRQFSGILRVMPFRENDKLHESWRKRQQEWAEQGTVMFLWE